MEVHTHMIESWIGNHHSFPLENIEIERWVGRNEYCSFRGPNMYHYSLYNISSIIPRRWLNRSHTERSIASATSGITGHRLRLPILYPQTHFFRNLFGSQFRPICQNAAKLFGCFWGFQNLFFGFSAKFCIFQSTTENNLLDYMGNL